MTQQAEQYKAQVIEELGELPEELIKEVADFAAFLKLKYLVTVDEEDAIFLKKRWEESLIEDKEGKTIPVEEAFTRIKAPRRFTKPKVARNEAISR
jgi:hypothetical protein